VAQVPPTMKKGPRATVHDAVTVRSRPPRPLGGPAPGGSAWPGRDRSDRLHRRPHPRPARGARGHDQKRRGCGRLVVRRRAQPVWVVKMISDGCADANGKVLV
jgi:hypothetical protein